MYGKGYFQSFPALYSTFETGLNSLGKSHLESTVEIRHASVHEFSLHHPTWDWTGWAKEGKVQVNLYMRIDSPFLNSSLSVLSRFVASVRVELKKLEDKSGIKQHLSWVLVNYWRNFTKLIYWWDAMKQGALAFQTEGSCGSYPLSQSTISFFEGKRNPWLQPASNLGWYQLATWLKPDPIRFNHVESGYKSLVKRNCLAKPN